MTTLTEDELKIIITGLEKDLEEERRLLEMSQARVRELLLYESLYKYLIDNLVRNR